MVRSAAGILVLLLAVPALADKDQPRNKPTTPAEQYKALLKEYQDAQEAFQKAYEAAKTDAEREKVFEDKYPQPEKFTPRFLELAEKNPRDAVAVDALVWVVTNSFGRTAGKDSPQARALALLGRDYIASEKLGEVCHALVYGSDKQGEAFLRTLLQKSPHRDVQGQACLTLGQVLKGRVRSLDQLKNRPELKGAYESSLGKDFLEELQKQDPAKVSSEAEALFERAAEKYADVKLPSRGTVGDRARSELYEIHFLAVGKEVPEVEGRDQDGKPLKLSDYRGKVVLLDFWSRH
jgi:hypothetical protein